MPPDEIIDGELLPAVIQPPAPLTLFGTSDPKVALERMAEIARLLVGVVRDRNLVKKISGGEYLLAPAWSVLAGMTGLAPSTAWVRALEDGTGFTARVEVLRIADGAVLSAAEQVCTRSESRWARAEDHALIGMAQTRASSRALRNLLMQVVELAGYQATPAEEMPAEIAAAPARQDARPRDGGGPIPAEIRPTGGQKDEIFALIRSLQKISPGEDWGKRCQEIVGADWDHTTTTMAARLVEKLKAEFGALVDGEPPAT